MNLQVAVRALDYQGLFAISPRCSTMLQRYRSRVHIVWPRAVATPFEGVVSPVEFGGHFESICMRILSKNCVDDFDSDRMNKKH